MGVVHIKNHTGLAHLLYEKTTPAGVPMDILVIRGTFDFAPGSAMTLSDTQSEIVLCDRLDGPIATHPLQAVIAEEGDAVLGKPGTDVLLQGSVQSYRGQWQTGWAVEVMVGPVRKALKVYGPRTLSRTLLGWSLGEPERVEKVALSYRLAFGGCFYDPEPSPDQHPVPSVSYPGNAAGCGWLPNTAALNTLPAPVRERIDAHIEQLRSLPAPQIEAPSEPYKGPSQRVLPAGLTALARWWAPRVGLQGTLDARWLAERYPRLPEDFDPRFYQSAPADQVAVPYLTGDEAVQLKGCLSEGDYATQLPGVTPLVVCESADGECHVSLPVLDTVRLDLDQRQAVLLWRLPVTAGISHMTMALLSTTALPGKS